jgi:protein SCO1/2
VKNKFRFLLFVFSYFLLCSTYASNKNERSIYDFSQVWKDHTGGDVQLSSLKGHIAVVTMVFTSCLGACPTMINNMKRFDKELSASEKQKIKFYAFSMDPKRDKPEVLAAFKQKMELDDRWKFFTSNASQVRELSIALGFNYMELESGDFSHSTTLYLISPNGSILAQQDHGSSWDQFLAKFQETIKSQESKK